MLSLPVVLLFFFKQKTAYEMRISDWSSDVCSSDLVARAHLQPPGVVSAFELQLLQLLLQRLVFAEGYGQRRAERHAGGREQLEGLFNAFHDRLDADAGAQAEAEGRRGVGLGLDLDELVDRAGLLAVAEGAFVHSVISAVE